jgi:hypothetical protein
MRSACSAAPEGKHGALRRNEHHADSACGSLHELPGSGIARVAPGEKPAGMEIRLEIELAADAAAAWRVVGAEFGRIGEWAAAVDRSWLDAERPACGVSRTCESPAFAEDLRRRRSAPRARRRGRSARRGAR